MLLCENDDDVRSPAGLKMAIIQIGLGVLLVVAGRRLFWAIVAVLGFALGYIVAKHFFPAQDTSIQIMIVLAGGFLGAMLLVFLQKLAIGVAGFVAGGYGLQVLWNMVDLRNTLPDWVIFLVGGIIGAMLVTVLFAWSLVVLSSFAGTSLLAQAVHLDQPFDLIFFVAVLGFGIAFQSGLLRIHT